ncbi:MAG: transporter [Bacteroidetes bacterium HGW-Bacteroidetes-11]|nr:MAG: transporter [Bacteroidetes bacterium HGW-Bacteroidetes-11]
MWNLLVRFILRNRLGNLIAIILITAFMGYKAVNVHLSYEMAQMLPASDTTSKAYEKFKTTFGQDGSVLFIGIKDEKLFTLNEFNDWLELTASLRHVDGVQEVVSIGKLYTLEKNDSSRKFDFKPLFEQKPANQAELDSIRKLIFNLPFYDGLIINKETNATLMMLTLDKARLNNKSRIDLIRDIETEVEAFSSKHEIDVHYSGMPYIRTKTMKMVQNELLLFTVLSMLIASIVLFIFFRSFKAVLFPMLIVIISVIWLMGIMGIMGYEITILTGILPPLLIIIGVENCIFLLNKYHHEFREHGNKVKALSRVVVRTGNATFLTNLTTATGFAAFIITGNKLLVEFGIIASINIMVVFILSIFLIPILYSYLAPPETRHLKHLDNKYTTGIIEKVVHLVLNHRRAIYITTIIGIVLAGIGISKLKTTGNVVDDIPHGHPMYVDLLFFEEEFKGILPFEISIDTRKPRGVMQMSTIQKISDLQDTLALYPEFSKPISVAELVKYSKQAFYNGDPEMYSIPNSQERNFILQYLPSMKSERKTILNSFVDTSLSKTRISVQMANIGTRDIQRIKDDLQPKINSIFDPDKFDVEITGTSIVFLKGTDYLVHNLITSLILAVIAIAILLGMLFTSFKMVVVSMVPNLLPQLMTAALMGFLAISIKPSTILIFSIALGISVDNAIHFLSRYRLALKHNNWNIKISVLSALRETGFSMVYSSIVLFLGFSIFTLSTFGGTQSMGFLISFTLLMALFSNLLLLPSLLLTLDRRITTRNFEEPLIEIFDENDESEADDVEVGYADNTISEKSDKL